MATKKIFLVDTENVGSTWKDLLPVKTGSDQILLFFTENSPNISYTDLQLILQFPDRFEMIKCNPGKNGLDFQLVSYLGYLLKTASKSNYVIVSNDSGFDVVVKFWQERGMSISRMNVHRVLRSDSIQEQKNLTDSAPTKSEKHEQTASAKTAITADRGHKIPPHNSPAQEIMPEPSENTLQTAQGNLTEEPQNTAEKLSHSQDSTIMENIVKPEEDTAALKMEDTPINTQAQGEVSETRDAKGGSGKISANTSREKKSSSKGKKARGKTAVANIEEEAVVPVVVTQKKDTTDTDIPDDNAKKAVPPNEPAFSDSDIEFDFSNLTVSEKAALLRKYLPKEFSENQESFETISDIIFGHNTHNHHQLHLAFVKSFGDEKGTLLYKTFRRHLSEFRA